MFSMTLEKKKKSTSLWQQYIITTVIKQKLHFCYIAACFPSYFIMQLISYLRWNLYQKIEIHIIKYKCHVVHMLYCKTLFKCSCKNCLAFCSPQHEQVLLSVVSYKTVMFSYKTKTNQNFLDTAIFMNVGLEN